MVANPVGADGEREVPNGVLSALLAPVRLPSPPKRRLCRWIKGAEVGQVGTGVAA